MAEGVRRSGRERKANPRYSLEEIFRDEFDDDSLHPQEDDDTDASSFEHVENEENDEDDDVLALSENEDIASELAEEAEPGEESDEGQFLPMDLDAVTKPLSASSKALKKANSAAIKKAITRKFTAQRTDGLRSRGLQFHTSIMSKEITMNELAGYDPVLTEKMKVERSKYGAIMTFPFRESKGSGQSGNGYPQVLDDEVREQERQRFLNWYSRNEGWKTLAKVQSMVKLDARHRSLYEYTSLPPQNILLGPYNAQHHFVLNYQDSLSVSEAWKTAIANTPNPNEYDEDASNRQSWILNVGVRVLALEWAPNQNGEYQYLAIAVDRDRPEHIPKASALEAEEPFEAACQIWAFKTKTQDQITLMDLDTKPKLVHVVCAKWGVIRRLSWCPAAVSIEENPSSIGILAMLSSDGWVRAIDVCVDLTITNPYVMHDAVGFASRPPNTICTCITWLSGNTLAAGCSDGHVAVWNLDQSLQAQKSVLDQTGQLIEFAIPFWYHSLHSTYIISIVGHQPYPSEYITTNGVDGKVRLTSLRRPHADSCYGLRERHIMPPIIYSPHILGIYETDEVDGIRARPLRHMPVSRAVAKAPAQVVSMAAGNANPTLAFGCANGEVILTNPIRRMFIRRLTDSRIEAWQQTWFKHEYVPSIRSHPTDYTTSLNYDLQKTSHVLPRPGMSRFLESLKPETVPLVRNIQAIREGNARSNKSKDAEDDETPAKIKKLAKKAKRRETEKATHEDVQISIYEEEQAVTCVSWNPNIQTGGWLAAGMANGLVRIEDLAV